MLLTQWHAAHPQTPFAWVSLDAGDDDPVRFWSYVVAAIRTVVPGFGGAVLAALPNAGPSMVEVVLPRLINELALLEAPVVLVLDDYHLLGDELLHASVAYLVRHLPRTLRIAIASRADPPLPLARLRAAGELVEIRVQELQFADAEADQLLNGTLELGLEAADVHRLQERTEGWPAGLQLAALSLRGRSDRAAFIRSLAGDDRQIGDYLHEVVEDAPRPLREFLLRTSILERMCAPLCAAVTGRADSAALLAEAFRSNLFVVALDDRGYWFRYHHLLRDLLQRELVRSEPDARRGAARPRGGMAQRRRERRRGDRPRGRRRPGRGRRRADRRELAGGVGPQPRHRRALAAGAAAGRGRGRRAAGPGPRLGGAVHGPAR